MPIPPAVSKNTIYGTLPGGEIFNWSLWASDAPLSNDFAQTRANAIATAFNAAPGVNLPPWMLIGADAKYVGVRVYSYLTGGTKADYMADAPINKTGASGAATTLPNQSALVVSLRTTRAGRRHMGRVYLPMTKFALASGGQVDTSSIDTLAGWFATFISAINSSMGGGPKVAVVSQADLTGAGISSVTSVKVDSKVDIQRRRANRQVATYSKTVTVA